LALQYKKNYTFGGIWMPQIPEELPITIWSWLIALFPLVLILLLLVWRRWEASEAGAIGFFAAILTAMLIFQTPLETVAVGAGKGIWDGIFILYVVWPALLLYIVTKEAAAFEAIRQHIQKVTENQLFLVLAFGWVFASFLQGIAGFGAPIAIVAPLLVGIGVNPIMAVVIPLIGHAWANLFGTLAVAWEATTLVVDIIDEPTTTFYSGILLWIPNLLSGFFICYLFGKWKAVKTGFWAVIIISLIHGGGQLILTQVNPTLSNFVPGIIAMGALFFLAKWSLYQKQVIEDSPVLTEASKKAEKDEEEPVLSLHGALFPYYVLTVLTVVALAIPAISEFLGQWEIGFEFPEVETGFGVVREAEDPYSPFAILTHPGTFLLIASIVAYYWFRSKGLYEDKVGGRLWAGLKKNAIPASVAILGFIAMSTVLDHSGQTTILALGIAEVSPPVVYAGLAAIIGAIGSFMTSSNTTSNVLFAPLHDQVAMALPELGQSLAIASQSAGGAIGNAIAPANVVLGTGTAGALGKEGEVLRYTLVYTAIAAALTGIGAVIIFLLT
jgi:lactate permease